MTFPIVSRDHEDIAHRVCDEIDRLKGADAIAATVQARTGQPLLFVPIRPEWRQHIAFLIAAWEQSPVRRLLARATEMDVRRFMVMRLSRVRLFAR